jgi:hypothetical protein
MIVLNISEESKKVEDKENSLVPRCLHWLKENLSMFSMT